MSPAASRMENGCCVVFRSTSQSHWNDGQVEDDETLFRLLGGEQMVEFLQKLIQRPDATMEPVLVELEEWKCNLTVISLPGNVSEESSSRVSKKMWSWSCCSWWWQRFHSIYRGPERLLEWSEDLVPFPQPLSVVIVWRPPRSRLRGGLQSWWQPTGAQEGKGTLFSFSAGCQEVGWHGGRTDGFSIQQKLGHLPALRSKTNAIRLRKENASKILRVKTTWWGFRVGKILKLLAF